MLPARPTPRRFTRYEYERMIDAGQPEPDIAVVRGSHRDYLDAHPREAALVVEVAESSLAYDRGAKRALYAAAAIPEYWIVNLVDRHVEIHRAPQSSDYGDVDVVVQGSLTPAGATAPGALADILP